MISTPNDIRVDEYIEAYIPAVIIWILMLSILALPKYSIINALFQTILILLWSYGGHVLAHKISSTGPLSYLNPHVFLHHDKKIKLSRTLELCIEAIVNFFGFFIIFIIQKLFNYDIFSLSLLIGSAFLYIIIHILDYSMNANIKHTLHHTIHYCNYEPELFDTLFGTRCEPQKPYTNMFIEIPHAIFAFLLAGSIKIYFNLD